MLLKDLKTIVTGSGTGIGRAIAERFAKEGAKVLIAEIEEIGGKETERFINNNGGHALYHNTDMSNEDSIKEMISKVISKFGGIDVIVNNAAAFVFGSIEEIGPTDWERVLGVNVLGYANTVKYSLPYLKESKYASIVNIASVSSFIAQPKFVPYNTSKGAISQMTRCLAMDLAEYQIRVNAVCPGAIYTRASERHMDFLGIDYEKGKNEFGKNSLMKRMGTPEEIANGVVFLASNQSSYITGEHLVIDGGATI
tara:strand:- start:514 stop:1275 length:762 start_codon:yes stop_codon:yes gene_type:complete